jgi:hypothetical protein
MILLCTVLLTIAGCPLIPRGELPIPPSILNACPGYSEEGIRQSIQVVEDDRGAGTPRDESFDNFELGCTGTCETINCVADCLDCGQAIYDVIYGES